MVLATRYWVFSFLAFAHPTPALAQQGILPALTQQPFVQKLPPPPQQQQSDPNRPDPKRPPPWMFRGMVALDGEVALGAAIETPVTGLGNEALWDALPAPHAVAAAAKPR